ncbi:MAG: alanine dehydrogenase [Epsilonproteobacteria bacterium]|nr:alanine dehydrogenase [Campylobacterota bacterium]
MLIGIPKEIKKEEFRVAMTPANVKELTSRGTEVYVEYSAGMGSGFSDQDYAKAGAILTDVDTLFNTVQLIIKVKEPIAQEYHRFKTHHTLFTYLHLAADKALTTFLMDQNITAFSYETLVDHNKLPLLEPMSEIAGKMAMLNGAFYLGRYFNGIGKLAAGAVGTPKTNVLVLGGGVAGKAAADVASGLGAYVTIMDINLSRLHYLDDVMPPNVQTLYSTKASIEALLPSIDIVIGTVLIPGEKAPKLITKEMLGLMQKGAVLVDVSIDQGGCFETSKATTHADPIYEVDGIIHYCVANMPGNYPQSSTIALSNATLPYIKQISKEGLTLLKNGDNRFITALNTFAGQLTNQAVAKAHHIEYTPYG